MSAARNLLTELQQQGIELTANGDRLHIKAPVGAVTPALRETLASYKVELLQLLAASDRSSNVRVWSFMVDGKRVTGIDPERLSEADYRAFLDNKFGRDRVSGLRAIIQKRLGSHANQIKLVANQLATAKIAFKTLPVSSQISTLA